MANLSYEDRKAIEKYHSIYYTLRSNSLVNQSLTSDVGGTIVTTENVVVDENIIYDAGEISFAKEGLYSFSVQLNLDVVNGTNAEFESWVEYFDGNDWIVYPNSGRYIEFGSRTEGVVSYNSDLVIIGEVKFRLKARAKSQDISLSTYTLDNFTIAPSVILSISRL